MASRRLMTSLIRHSQTLIPSIQHLPHFLPPSLHTLTPFSHAFSSEPLNPKTPNFTRQHQTTDDHHNATDEDDDDEDDEDDDEDDEEMSDDEEDSPSNVNLSPITRAYSLEEKINEAADIGYKVIGPLRPDDRVFKLYEPVFAVVQIGSHQFKVSNGDKIYVEKLKFCEVNDKLSLNKVLMVGSPTQTIIGRPILADAAVHAIVEEHALDAKVIIFKKKRRKNYRRTNGHRQELTRLRITDIQGIEKPETPPTEKTSKTPSSKKEEKVAVAA